MPSKFATKIYRCDFTLQEAKNDQQKFEILINKLNNNYDPIKQIKIKEKDDTLNSARKLLFIRKRLLQRLKRYFPVHIWISSEKRNR